MNGDKAERGAGEESAPSNPGASPAKSQSSAKDTHKTDDDNEAGLRSDRMYIDLGTGITHMLTEGKGHGRSAVYCLGLPEAFRDIKSLSVLS